MWHRAILAGKFHGKRVIRWCKQMFQDNIKMLSVMWDGLVKCLTGCRCRAGVRKTILILTQLNAKWGSDRLYRLELPRPPYTSVWNRGIEHFVTWWWSQVLFTFHYGCIWMRSLQEMLNEGSCTFNFCLRRYKLCIISVLQTLNFHIDEFVLSHSVSSCLAFVFCWIF